MIRIDAGERRRRLAVRHRLAPGYLAGDPADLARSVVALHATDPATVYLAVGARTTGRGDPAALDAAIYQDRRLIRMLGMRRTIFVFPADLAAVVQRSTTNRIAADQRGLLLRLLAEAGSITDPDTWASDAESAVLSVMAAAGGSATAAELTAAVPALRTQLLLAPGKPYQATTNVTGRLLFVLAAEGKLVRGRPTGSWLSQQYRWWLTQRWLPGALDTEISDAAARAELARQWLSAFGPAPISDLKWWTGWTMGEVRQAVGDLKLVEVDLGEGKAPGLALPDDLDLTADPGPWAALLPALDPTVMGWADRSWFLGPHAGALFDRTGNAGPTVWLSGRVVGGWAQRRDGEVVVRLLEDVGRLGEDLIAERAAGLRDWLGDRLVTPRFRTPTERDLTS